MKSSEAVLVGDGWVTSALQEQVNHINHVLLGCLVNWRIATYLRMVLNVGVSIIME